MSSPLDDRECPVCGQQYEERIVVERGDRWADLFPGTPLDFFQRYRRRCAAQVDVERETQRSDAERVVYFHGGRERAVP
ncbi:MAG: hypothetical protein ABEJ23_04485 [Haloarculaceae archaeon]